MAKPKKLKQGKSQDLSGKVTLQIDDKTGVKNVDIDTSDIAPGMKKAVKNTKKAVKTIKKDIKKLKKKSSKKTTQRKKPERFKLSHVYRQMAWELNRAYDEVKESGYTSNNIKLFEQTLEAFYANAGKKVKNPHHISLQAHMSKEQIEELANITDTFVNIAVNDRAFYLSDITKGLTPKDMEIIQNRQQEIAFDNVMPRESIEAKSKLDEIPWETFDVDRFEAIKDKYGIDSVQGFVDFVDAMERRRVSGLMDTLLSSHQLAEAFAYAESKGYGYEYVMRTAYKEYYKNKGITRDPLYEQIIKHIEGKKIRK